jgi:hypothetical protein
MARAFSLTSPTSLIGGSLFAFASKDVSGAGRESPRTRGAPRVALTRCRGMASVGGARASDY